MWDDSIIKYPGAPFQARRRYGARRIIRKNCAYRGKLRDNPQIARSGAIHRAAAVLRASRSGRCPSIARFFCEAPKSGSRKSGEAQIRKRRRGSAVRTRSRTENQARGSAVLFAMPRALPRFLSTFLWRAQTRRDRAARERGGRRAQPPLAMKARRYTKRAHPNNSRTRPYRLCSITWFRLPP